MTHTSSLGRRSPLEILGPSARVCLTDLTVRSYGQAIGRTDLTESQWRTLAPHLPGNPRRGHAYTDHRRVINGILWRLKTGATWRDIPERYGPWQTCFDRFVRWSRDGTWQRILTALQVKQDADGHIDWDGAAADSTHVRAQRSATGARKTPARLEKRG